MFLEVPYIIKRLKDSEFTPDIYHVVKMLYFADRAHLLKYDDSITLTKYSYFDESIKEEFKVVKDDNGNSTNKLELLEKKIDLSYLSETNKECLNAAIAKYGGYSFNELKNESHDDIYESVNGEITIFNMLDVLNTNKKFAEHVLEIFQNKTIFV